MPQDIRIMTRVDGSQSGITQPNWVDVTSSNPLPVTAAGGSGTTSAPVAPATATATKSTLVGLQYNATPPTATDGQQGSAQGDAHLSLKVAVCDSTGTPVSTTAAVQVYQSTSFLNVAAGLATTTVKSGAGTFATLTINTKGAASNTLTIYDNTAASGTKIATIDTTAAQVTLNFNIAFTTGLTLISQTGTGADYTVGYI